jgi:hypothetical protein
MKYNFSRVWMFVLLTIVLVGALHYLPTLSIGDHTLRRVNLLADLLPKEPDSSFVSVDSLLPPPPKPAFVDTCKVGVTCIEDFSDSTQRGMKLFYEALDQAERRPVRIAYLGDSFIEGDIMTGDLRKLLQQAYGGSGVGYVDITSPVSGFRGTVRHRYHGWESHGPIDSTGYRSQYAALSCHYFRPHVGAMVEYGGDTCQQAMLLLESYKPSTLRALVNGRDTTLLQVEASPRMQGITVNGRIGKVRWDVERADSSLFFGVALESRRGIILDNFGQRSSSGLQLRQLPLQRLQELNRLRPYDLIVLQYGLNIASRFGSNYDHYESGMLTVIEHLRNAFPQAALLLVSVGDREYRDSEGELHSMPGVKNLILYQEHIAATAGIAFWNLYDAMGGEGSMARMVQASQANLDYTHINFRGGKVLAQKLFETLSYGKEQYDKRKKYENE